jgi:hypothetical protein
MKRPMNTPETLEAESEQSSTITEQFTEKDYRKERVWELVSRGYSYRDILTELASKDPLLRISLGTISADVRAKKQEIDEAYRNYVDQTLPEQHAMALTNLQGVVRSAWRIAESAKTDGDRIQALRTVAMAQSAIDDLMTAPESIQKAIKLVRRLKQ